MKCDIIILVWNLFDFSKACIESVLEKTNFDFHLIVVDNASAEPTKGYLNNLAQHEKGRVTLLRNEENLGFIKAANQGIRATTAPYICLLNNDTLVTQGWLTEMVKVAQSRADIGIVNPHSNTLGWKPKKGESLEVTAQKLRSFSGKYSELAWATGFCMLVKRKVVQEVGLFDEIYGRGTFEDADFNKRAQARGYFSVCAQGAYVYHRERRSFIKVSKFDQDFERNRQIFYAKWGKTYRILYVLTRDNNTFTEKVRQEALKLARQGNIVWFFSKNRDRQKISRHSNIYAYSLPKPFFNLVSLWRIMKRQKKFDKIYVDDESYARRLNNFKRFHKAEVIYAQ